MQLHGLAKFIFFNYRFMLQKNRLNEKKCTGTLLLTASIENNKNSYLSFATWSL
jgi:hypothetical protein